MAVAEGQHLQGPTSQPQSVIEVRWQETNSSLPLRWRPKNIAIYARIGTGIHTDGRFLYVSIGSNSNVGENGMAAEEDRARIWEVDVQTGQHRAFATGLRNPNGLAFAPSPAPVLWTAVNERDELDSDLVPDYMTSVRDGGFYGWPFSYYGQHVDERAQPQQPASVAEAIAPDYALGAHTASLGLAITARSGLPWPFVSGAFVGQHGSWNRRPPSEYRVIFVAFVDGKPRGAPLDVLTGFLDPEGQARGRRSAWRSTGAAGCWWPTTSATLSGA